MNLGLSYHFANEIAYMVAKDTNEKIDDIIWSMSALQVFKIVSICYTANTGKSSITHEEKKVIRRQQEIFTELQNGEST